MANWGSDSMSGSLAMTSTGSSLVWASPVHTEGRREAGGNKGSCALHVTFHPPTALLINVLSFPKTSLMIYCQSEAAILYRDQPLTLQSTSYVSLYPSCSLPFATLFSLDNWSLASNFIPEIYHLSKCLMPKLLPRAPLNHLKR